MMSLPSRRRQRVRSKGKSVVSKLAKSSKKRSVVEQLELERKQTRTSDKKRRKLNQDPIQTNLITKFTKTLESKEEHLEQTTPWISATLDPEILVEQTVLKDQYEDIADDGPFIQISRQKWTCKDANKGCTRRLRLGKRRT